MTSPRCWLVGLTCLVASTCGCSPMDTSDDVAEEICAEAGPTHLAQIALAHAFDGNYQISIHRGAETASCTFATIDGCAKLPECSAAVSSSESDLAVFGVRNTTCGDSVPTDIEWRDVKHPWKVVLGRSDSAPVRLTVQRNKQIVFDAEVKLTFPGDGECAFSPFATTTAF